MRRALFVALALAAAGCAENAILEVTLEMRTADEVGVPGATQAVVTFESSDAARSEDVRPSEQRTVRLDLPASSPATARVSVVANGEEIERPLWVSFRYCGGPVACPFDGDRAWVRYDRAFYLGQYTSHTLALPDDGAADATVPTCEVEGCVPGTGGCRMDGTHWCLE